VISHKEHKEKILEIFYKKFLFDFFVFFVAINLNPFHE